MIYLVEDDKNIRELVVYTLTGCALETRGFGLPSEFWAEMEKSLPALILLDIMLPEEDGLSILKKLRVDPETREIPVLMLSAKGSEYDRVIGLDSGADDYLPKPFGMMELIARVKALLRRVDKVSVREEYHIGCLTVCPEQHTALVDGVEVQLTYKEFELLIKLLRNRGVVLTRDQLLNDIWGYAFDGENRTVDVHIRTLRQKLGAAGEYIETVRGVGYKISRT